MLAPRPSTVLLGASCTAMWAILLSPDVAAAQDAPRILLDQPLRAVEYQLGRLTNEELVLVERKADDPRYRPIYFALLTRKGIPAQFRDEAVTRPSGQRVVLALLGTRHFVARNENPKLLTPNKDNYIITRSILNLRVKAFVEKAVLSQTDNQTIYVIVQDQNLQPVDKAQILLTIRYPSGKEERLMIPEHTDEGGNTHWSFVVDEDTRGIVEIGVAVTYNALKQNTRTSFRIWW